CLHQLLIVSEINIIKSSKLEIKIIKATGKTCPRCWNVTNYNMDKYRHGSPCVLLDRLINPSLAIQAQRPKIASFNHNSVRNGLNRFTITVL
ncbi:MAG: hypothetical protein Q8836_02455, partial [Sweet potato little leaf phytoplasma]|nr:hypothetical protein [Sweet potato little leaf phytoplasma]